MMTTHKVQKSRPHFKILCNDYFTYDRDREDLPTAVPVLRNEASPEKRLLENIQHILTVCTVYPDIRERIFHEILSLKLGNNFNSVQCDCSRLTQFVLDPLSLKPKEKISLSDLNLVAFSNFQEIMPSVHSRRIK